MGVVNVTPDSFSDGGSYFDPGRRRRARSRARRRGGGGDRRRRRVHAAGRRPGRRRRGAATGRAGRAGPRRSGARSPSASTRRRPSSRAQRSTRASPIVNDVSGGTADPEILRVAAAAGAGYVAMHTRGTPRTMQQEARYVDVVREVGDELRRASSGGDATRASTRACCSPTRASDSPRRPSTISRCCARCPTIAARVGFPLLVGISRKSFLARMVPGDERSSRDDATLATTVWCFEQGVALVRVHDVDGSRRAVALPRTLERATPEGVAA